MGRGERPGAFEHTVLLALAGMEGEAGGGDVYDALVAATGRDVSVAAVHITLRRMEEKGWVEVRSTDPPPERGGKKRRHYRLSPAGADVLREQRADYDRLWGRARPHLDPGE